MKFSPLFVLSALTAITIFVAPCLAQDTAQSGQAAPAVTGTGNANHIAVWKNSTTLGSSGIIATGGNIGIGTVPESKLDVAGDIDFTGSVRYQGSIFMQPPPGTNGSFGSNTGVGIGALQSNTSGVSNTAIGNNVLFKNIDGFSNTALGAGTLSSNTSGSLNTATGVNVLVVNTTGNSNTGIGIIALNDNTTGSNNTAVGAESLIFNTTGNNNTAIGGGAGEFLGAGDNNVYISNVGPGNIQNLGSESGVIRIGTPLTQNSAFIAGIYGSSTGLANVAVVVDANGNLGTVQSSRRYKEDIQDMADASDGLMQLRPVTFRYKKAFDDGAKPVQYGLIAEEVAEVYPDLVARSADGQIETVRYQLLDSMLLNELQKQNVTITAQREQIQAQEQRARTQQQHIQSLEDRLARIEAAIGNSVTTSSH